MPKKKKKKRRKKMTGKKTVLIDQDNQNNFQGLTKIKWIVGIKKKIKQKKNSNIKGIKILLRYVQYTYSYTKTAK